MNIDLPTNKIIIQLQTELEFGLCSKIKHFKSTAQKKSWDVPFFLDYNSLMHANTIRVYRVRAV